MGLWPCISLRGASALAFAWGVLALAAATPAAARAPAATGERGLRARNPTPRLRGLLPPAPGTHIPPTGRHPAGRPQPTPQRAAPQQPFPSHPKPHKHLRPATLQEPPPRPASRSGWRGTPRPARARSGPRSAPPTARPPARAPAPQPPLSRSTSGSWSTLAAPSARLPSRGRSSRRLARPWWRVAGTPCPMAPSACLRWAAREGVGEEMAGPDGLPAGSACHRFIIHNSAAAGASRHSVLPRPGPGACACQWRPPLAHLQPMSALTRERPCHALPKTPLLPCSAASH
jgi:hypothetical protein